MSYQVCGCCGWSKATSYKGLRIHQGKMGCTPKGMSIPESEQYRFNSFTPKVTFGPTIKEEKPFAGIFTPSIKSVDEESILRTVWEEPIYSTPVSKEPFLTPVSQAFNMQTNLAAAEAILKDTYKSVFETPPRSYHTNTSARRALDFSTGAQQPFSMPVSQAFNSHLTDAEAVLKDTNKSLFEIPQHSYQTTINARRALDFSTGAQQLGQLPWLLQTTTDQETAVEREAQKLLKAKQDKIRAELQQEIQLREQKMAEVRSSANAFKGSLDAECQEINKVFSEVKRVVEDAWKKALQPLEERRHRVKGEAQDLVKKLQKETDKLKRALDELDQNPDFQVSPLTGLDESRDWKNVTVDVSFSLGTLRSQTSNMMKQIQQNLEKLSSVELKRIPTFAVDVKLDPTTAHRCLDLSHDGKEVRDGGTNPRVPAGPERFDMFGSVLGLNRLTSGKYYWEVEVSNKTGWDLGVARRNANRKGELLLTPGNGYWVTVHYEDKKYAALSEPPVSLSLPVKPQKVGVFVDYEEGLVSFYDVTAQSHIYSFTGCSFSSEICPYFSPHLQQNEKNCDPLVISAVKKHQKL